jgi:integrase/recombinase XerD
MKLTEIVTEYLTYKRALGMDFRNEERMFAAFCRQVGDVQMESISPEQIRFYLDGTKPVSSNWMHKYTAVSGLYRFALSRNYVSTLPLPTCRPKCPPPLVPYIYSRAELKRLLDNTPAACGPQVQMEAFVFRTLILVLYGACLRHGEALHLTINDVDLEQGILYVRETKFYKTRLVPLGRDLHEALNQYVIKRNAIHCNELTSPFFCFHDGRALSHQAVQSAFRRLRIQAGVQRNDNANYQPRLHDLRHTGVVHRLIAWYRSGADLNRLLPQLSTYLGHIGLASTQHYLTLTPELLCEASLRFERFAMEKPHD